MYTTVDTRWHGLLGWMTRSSTLAIRITRFLCLCFPGPARGPGCSLCCTSTARPSTPAVSRAAANTGTHAWLVVDPVKQSPRTWGFRTSPCSNEDALKKPRIKALSPSASLHSCCLTVHHTFLWPPSAKHSTTLKCHALSIWRASVVQLAFCAVCCM